MTTTTTTTTAGTPSCRRVLPRRLGNHLLVLRLLLLDLQRPCSLSLTSRRACLVLRSGPAPRLSLRRKWGHPCLLTASRGAVRPRHHQRT